MDINNMTKINLNLRNDGMDSMDDGSLDAGQIMDDLIPIRRQDEGVFIGNPGCLIIESRIANRIGYDAKRSAPCAMLSVVEEKYLYRKYREVLMKIVLNIIIATLMMIIVLSG